MERNMKKIICEKLKEIENKENVKIILAVESGSRAWGFESIDSDYDVRFIYVRKTNDYLKLEDARDVIEWQLDDVLDINGWDLKKALKLIYKSNPSIFEWLSSPIIYKETEEAYWLRNVAKKYFSTKTSIYHYYNMAKGNYRMYLQEENIRLKKYFYVLRPILAASYVEKNNKQAPMEFLDLMNLELPDNLKKIVENLLEKKKSNIEMGLHAKILELNDYVEERLVYYKKKLEMLKSCDNNWDELEKLFLNILYKDEKKNLTDNEIVKSEKKEVFIEKQKEKKLTKKERKNLFYNEIRKREREEIERIYIEKEKEKQREKRKLFYNEKRKIEKKEEKQEKIERKEIKETIKFILKSILILIVVIIVIKYIYEILAILFFFGIIGVLSSAPFWVILLIIFLL